MAAMTPSTPADPITKFEVVVVSADDCTGSFHYPVASGTLGKPVDGPWDGEPELETSGADIVVRHASGKEQRLGISGDQHRDLENFGGYEEAFRAMLAGVPLRDAVGQSLREEALAKEQAVQVSPPRSPRPR